MVGAHRGLNYLTSSQEEEDLEKKNQKNLIVGEEIHLTTVVRKLLFVIC